MARVMPRAHRDDAASITRSGGSHRRNSALTRESLLEAARVRFASAGYAESTTREIANDVGVNVALINRYFGSKAGLFETCLKSAFESILEPVRGVVDMSQIPDVIAKNMSLDLLSEGVPEALLLLFRPSGDDRAEEARLAVLRGFGENLAGLATEPPLEPESEDLLLRAQLVIAIGFGVSAIRSSRLEPLASTSTVTLSRHLARLVGSVFDTS